jgi:hypothetical protein
MLCRAFIAFKGSFSNYNTFSNCFFNWNQNLCSSHAKHSPHPEDDQSFSVLNPLNPLNARSKDFVSSSEFPRHTPVASISSREFVFYSELHLLQERCHIMYQLLKK